MPEPTPPNEELDELAAADDAPATFGARVKAARTHQGLTLKQAAAEIGITITTLHNAEQSRRTRQQNRMKIAKWLERVEVEQPACRPAPISSVGILLHGVLVAQGMTQAQAADTIGITQKHLSRIVAGASGLSYEIAIRLESVTGVPAAAWNAAEAAFRDRQLRQQTADA